MVPFSLSERFLYVGVLLTSISLPWSNFGMSLGGIISGLSLVSGPYTKIGSNPKYYKKLGALLLGIFLVFLIPLSYSQHVAEGLKDLQIKLPIMLWGLLYYFKGETLLKTLKQSEFVKYFSLSVILALLFCNLNSQFLWFETNDDIRKSSPFISHVRLSIMAGIAGAYFLSTIFEERGQKILMLLGFILVGLNTILLGWLTGIISIVIITALVPYYMTKKGKNNYLRAAAITATTFLALLIAISTYRIYPIITPGVIPGHLPKKTKNGRPYYHDTQNLFCENGNYYGILFQQEEIEKEWQKRSRIKLNQNDKKGNLIRFTCYRYLTSKGLSKDSIGVWALTEQDIRNIEAGIPNWQIPKLYAPEKRLYEIFTEWQISEEGFSQNGHSLSMRLVYWQTALNLLPDLWIIGTGTGGVEPAIKNYYSKNPTLLDPDYQKRTHNQYLTTLLNSGIIGFTVLILIIGLPLISSETRQNILPFASWILLAISMISEDTLETQAGVTLFCFAFLILGSKVYKEGSYTKQNIALPQHPN